MRRVVIGLLAVVALAGGAQAQSCSGTPNANTTCAGPSSGGSGFPSFRSQVNGDLPTSPANTVKGSIAGGAPTDLTATQLTTLCNVFTSSLSGCAPASGGGTTNFLRADGTWTAPGGGAITALTGDVTATGPGSVAATLATVNSNVGSFGSGTAIPNFTVNAKGLITAAGSTTLSASNITTGTLPAGQMPALTGDVTSTAGTVATTLAWISRAASKTLTINNSLTLTGTDATTMTFPSTNGTIAALNITDQTLTGGANVTSNNLGTISSGTTTLDCGARPLQFLTNNGAFTLAAPSNDGSCIVLVTNGASAGTITFSGFSVGSSTGDTYATTNANKYSLSVWRVNGTAGYRWAAHQ